MDSTLLRFIIILRSSHAQILALEEDLTEARDTIRRLVEGECVEWEVGA